MTTSDVTEAIDLLAGQDRAWTHELTLTPPAASWQG
jgi:hypothetical protein